MALSLQGTRVAQLASRLMEIHEDKIEETWKELCQYAVPICKLASDMPLPPLHAINYEINLIDPNRTYL